MGFSSSSNILLIVVACFLVNQAISGLSGNSAQHPPRDDDNRCSTGQNCSNSLNVASCNTLNVQCNQVDVLTVCKGAGCKGSCIFFQPQLAAILAGQYGSVTCCNSVEANYFVYDYDTVMQCNDVVCSVKANCCSCYAYNYNYTSTRSLDEQLDYDYSIN